MALTLANINRTANAKIIVSIKVENTGEHTKSFTYRFYAPKKDANFLAIQAKQMHGLNAVITKYQINGTNVNLN